MIFANTLQVNNNEAKDLVVHNSNGLSDIVWKQGKLAFNSFTDSNNHNNDDLRLAVGIKANSTAGGTAGTDFRYLLDGRDGCITAPMISCLSNQTADIDNKYTNKIPSCKSVNEWVNSMIVASQTNAMEYRGTITPQSTAGGAITGSMFYEEGEAKTYIPKKKGYLYKCSSNGYFGSASVENGDTIIVNRKYLPDYSFVLQESIEASSYFYFRIDDDEQLYRAQSYSEFDDGETVYLSIDEDENGLFKTIRIVYYDDGEGCYKLASSEAEEISSAPSGSTVITFTEGVTVQQSWFDILQTNVDLSGYLPLSAGSTKKITGDLYISQGKSLKFENDSYSSEIYLSIGEGVEGSMFFNCSNSFFGSILPSGTNSLGTSEHIWNRVYASQFYEGSGENSAPLSSIYLGINAIAANSYQLEGHGASYFAAANAVVSSLGGKTGVITILEGQSAAGSINLTMSGGGQLSAAGVGLIHTGNLGQQSVILALNNAISGNTARIDSLEYSTVYLNDVVDSLGKELSFVESYFDNGVALSALKLENARTIWGQSFNGTANVTGAMTGVTSIDSLLSFDTEDSQVSFSANILPSATSMKNLGSGTLRFKNAYLDTIYLPKDVSKGLAFGDADALISLDSNGYLQFGFASRYVFDDMVYASGFNAGNYGVTTSNSINILDEDGSLKFLDTENEEGVKMFYSRSENTLKIVATGSVQSGPTFSAYAFKENGSLLSTKYLGINGTAAKATKLETPRSIFGQSFDGSGNIEGSLSGVDDINGVMTMETNGAKIQNQLTLDCTSTANGTLILKSDEAFDVSITNDAGNLSLSSESYINLLQDTVIGSSSVTHDLTVHGNVEATTFNGKSVAGVYRGDITGDGSTTQFVFTHGLKNKHVGVSIYDSDGNMVLADVALSGTTETGSTAYKATVKFSEAPASNVTYKAVIFG